MKTRAGWSPGTKLRKYWAVAEIHLRSRWAYLWDTLASTIFLVLVLFVFVQLWRVTLGQGGTAIEGFTLEKMIWYYVATETLIMSMLPVHRTFEREIRDGDVAIRLNKPVNYLFFHAGAFLGEAAVKALLLALIGGAVTWIMVGPIEFNPVSIPAIVILYFTTTLLNFYYAAIIGLTAFWTEDITGLYFIMDRAKWLLGGFLLPVTLFPEPLRTIAQWLPFQWMIYAPAQVAVSFTWEGWSRTLAMQAILLALLGGFVTFLYSRGVKRLNLNGG